MTRFADITTIGVGGNIARFIEPTTRVGVIEAVEEADERGVPLCVIGGGSNLLASDEDFHGYVVRDARRNITVPDEAAPAEDNSRVVHVNAEAGCNWDDFVAFCCELSLEGVEALSGIPGTVGASVVQNIGAYGQEVASSVTSVEVWDRVEKRAFEMEAREMAFGYRTSLLKRSMYEQQSQGSVGGDGTGSTGRVDGTDRANGSGSGNSGATKLFPTPRYVVLSVTFALTHSGYGTIGYEQLAKALGASVGDRMPLKDLRDAVLAVRAAKGMLEDARRYQLDAMAGTKREENVAQALAAQESYSETELQNRHSCGSFFVNPVLDESRAERLPEDAPRFAAASGDSAGENNVPMVKTSAAWLIEHAGFPRGFALDGYPQASLSTKHTLALTNRGGATSKDIVRLAQHIQHGVAEKYGISLHPEPVIVGNSCL